MDGKKIRIGILGTGMVGRAHAERLASQGHAVALGTRDVEKTMSISKPDEMGNPPLSVWLKSRSGIKLNAFNEAAAFGDIIINALKGEAALQALKPLETALGSRILIDITNALDFSKGMPPALLVCNTDSLGEQIQRALPAVKVVKTFNTMSAPVQVNPALVAGGDHHIFVSGNDAGAKAAVTEMQRLWYGWKNIIDLGDITTARGVEMLMPIWLRLWPIMKTPMFNYKIVM